MKTTAVLGIDLQKGLFETEPLPFRVEEVSHNIRKILESARENGYKVFMIQHCEPPERGNLNPATEPWTICDQFLSIDSETVIHKEYPNSFRETDLELMLRGEGIDKLIICGMESENCIQATAAEAVGLKFRVIVAGDAHTTSFLNNKDGLKTISEVNKNLEIKGVLIKKTEEICKELNKDLHV